MMSHFKKLDMQKHVPVKLVTSTAPVIGDPLESTTIHQTSDAILIDGKLYTKEDVKNLIDNQLPNGYITIPLVAWDEQVKIEYECDVWRTYAEFLEEEIHKASDAILHQPEKALDILDDALCTSPKTVYERSVK